MELLAGMILFTAYFVTWSSSKTKHAPITKVKFITNLECFGLIFLPHTILPITIIPIFTLKPLIFNSLTNIPSSNLKFKLLLRVSFIM